jgi:hypothetical protein
MAAVTVSAAKEACDAIVDRINTGTAYTLAVYATTAEEFHDDTTTMGEELHVDVVPLSEQQLSETLATEDRTQHIIAVEIRQRMTAIDQQLVNNLKLTTRQIFQRLNNYDLASGRVRVWEISAAAEESPNRQLLAAHLVFRTRLTLRVIGEVP